MSIARTPVTSSNVRSIGYDSARQLLHVEFNAKDARMPGRVYEFSQVPVEAHHALMQAQSKGSHFARYIKGRYSCRTVDRPGPVVQQEQVQIPAAS